MNKGVFRRSRKELFAKIVKVLKIFINFFRRKLLPGWLTVFWIRFWLFEKMKANCSHFETIFIHDLYEKVAILEHFHCMKSVQIRTRNNNVFWHFLRSVSSSFSNYTEAVMMCSGNITFRGQTFNRYMTKICKKYSFSVISNGF